MNAAIEAVAVVFLSGFSSAVIYLIFDGVTRRSNDARYLRRRSLRDRRRRGKPAPENVGTWDGRRVSGYERRGWMEAAIQKGRQDRQAVFGAALADMRAAVTEVDERTQRDFLSHSGRLLELEIRADVCDYQRGNPLPPHRNGDSDVEREIRKLERKLEDLKDDFDDKFGKLNDELAAIKAKAKPAGEPAKAE